MRLTGTLPDDLAGDLRQFAVRTGQSVSAVVTEAVERRAIDRLQATPDEPHGGL